MNDKLIINDDGINLIKDFESLQLKAYYCSSNVLTIGYGHTANVSKGQVITEKKADQLLALDLRLFEQGVKKLVKSRLNENQFSALVSFAFNCGLGNLKKSTLLRKVNINPNDESIEAEFKKWNKSAGKISKGLIRRREAESDLYFKEL